MITLGLMQGRLTPSRGRGTQFFPFENWEAEFSFAQELGLDEIELIFDRDRFQENPLWSESGISRIALLSERHAIRTNHILADFFLRDPIWNNPESRQILSKLLRVAGLLKVRSIEIPFVDNSSIQTAEQRVLVQNFLRASLAEIESSKVVIGLEMDLPAPEFLDFLLELNSPFIKANYDTGNSAALGYDLEDELDILGGYISNIHIKDRPRNGKTVQLGAGDVKFPMFFKKIRELGYAGSLILQAARGEDGKELETVGQQIEFVRRGIKLA